MASARCQLQRMPHRKNFHRALLVSQAGDQPPYKRTSPGGGGRVGGLRDHPGARSQAHGLRLGLSRGLCPLPGSLSWGSQPGRAFPARPSSRPPQPAASAFPTAGAFRAAEAAIFSRGRDRFLAPLPPRGSEIRAGAVPGGGAGGPAGDPPCPSPGRTCAQRALPGGPGRGGAPWGTGPRAGGLPPTSCGRAPALQRPPCGHSPRPRGRAGLAAVQSRPGQGTDRHRLSPLLPSPPSCWKPAGGGRVEAEGRGACERGGAGSARSELGRRTAQYAPPPPAAPHGEDPGRPPRAFSGRESRAPRRPCPAGVGGGPAGWLPRLSPPPPSRARSPGTAAWPQARGSAYLGSPRGPTPESQPGDAWERRPGRGLGVPAAERARAVSARRVHGGPLAQAAGPGGGALALPGLPRLPAATVTAAPLQALPGPGPRPGSLRGRHGPARPFSSRSTASPASPSSRPTPSGIFGRIHALEEPGHGDLRPTHGVRAPKKGKMGPDPAISKTRFSGRESPILLIHPTASPPEPGLAALGSSVHARGPQMDKSRKASRSPGCHRAAERATRAGGVVSHLSSGKAVWPGVPFDSANPLGEKEPREKNLWVRRLLQPHLQRRKF
ncbi:collagen alpha-1(I) chain-like [Choloepus didactylus]|uniref:collagen alpha-1(I) chain-like n=1 Tax=Choloepus didactylus TaxID=27675 RepID=UPI0018A02A16|nr:collagen alpha-1(I) chain-like [Choloepus didactylus]